MEEHSGAAMSTEPDLSAVITPNDGGWAAYLPGGPTHGAGPTVQAAVDDLIGALRDYAEDWRDQLQAAPNHAPYRALVELVERSDDAQLRAHLRARATN
jgi:hypothetical protein